MLVTHSFKRHQYIYLVTNILKLATSLIHQHSVVTNITVTITRKNLLDWEITLNELSIYYNQYPGIIFEIL